MNEQVYMGANAPSATFQSTGTMLPSGSAYSSTPMLGQDGTATMSITVEPAKANGPRRIGPTTPEGPPTPIGDAVLPLMLLAGAFAFGKWIARTKPLR